MKTLYKNWKLQTLAFSSAALLLFSCNKDLPVAEPIVPAPPTGETIMAIVNGNANFTFLKAAIDRAGFATALNTATNVYTVFAPDNAAFQLSGIPSVDVINGLPVATLQSILNYHLIGGQRFPAANILDKYPNMYLPSMLFVAPPSAALPPGYRMPLGISRRGTNAWANQIPVKQADIAASNGVIHVVAALLSPPTQVLAQIVASDPSYSFLLAAVQRADQGPPPGAPQLLPILSNALANLTVFAPTDDAFKTLFGALGLPQETSSFALLPSATVWGIVAFHVQGVRAFSPNLSNTPRPSIMGVNQQFNVTPTAVQVRGPGNVVPTPGGPVNFFANVTSPNINAVNGVIHRTDAVLIPQ
jgi:uncharacterized surface protein with fasciclin (FAS1) repeats